jgi:mannosyl-oligosaccharide alpha-1,3-glucosidase
MGNWDRIDVNSTCFLVQSKNRSPSFLTDEPKKKDEELTYQLFILYNPFKIKLYLNDKLIIIVNERNLFNYEEYRKKEEQFFYQQEKCDATYFYKSKDLWESKFKGFEDKNINGPSSVGMDFTFPGIFEFRNHKFVESEQFYGLPQHAYKFALDDTTKNEPYRFFNLDAYEYALHTKLPLYGSLPYLLSVSRSQVLPKP